MTLKQHKLTDAIGWDDVRHRLKSVADTLCGTGEKSLVIDFAQLGRDIHRALAMHQASIPTEATGDDVERFDAGLLGDGGGGDVGWWQDYIRSLLEQADEHYREQFDTLSPNRVSQSVVERAIEQVTGRPVEYENDELTVAQVRKVIAALATQPATDTRIPINEEAMAEEIVSRSIERLRELPDYAGRPSWEQIVAEEIRKSIDRVSNDQG